jgi:hypothetical protein
VAESSRINIFFTLLWCSNDSEGHSTSSCLLKETLQIKRKMDTIHMPYHTHVLGTHRFIWHVQRKTMSAIVITVTREKYLLSGKGRKEKPTVKFVVGGFSFLFLWWWNVDSRRKLLTLKGHLFFLLQEERWRGNESFSMWHTGVQNIINYIFGWQICSVVDSWLCTSSATCVFTHTKVTLTWSGLACGSDKPLLLHHANE